MKRLDKHFRSTPPTSGAAHTPVTAPDLVGTGDTPGDPLAMQLFKSASISAKVPRQAPSSPTSHREFDPSSSEFEYIPEATSSTATTTDINYLNAERQPLLTKLARSAEQFGVNVAASVGQGLANTFDFHSMAKTINGEVTGGDDDFDSSLFGIKSSEMQNWANGVAQRNQIHRAEPGSVDLTDPGWWSEQFASSGTGVGMGIEALGTTIGIEALTGGEGTGVALAKLAKMVSNLRKVNMVKDGLEVVRGLKSAATMYGVLSRYSESRMEANQTYSQIYDELSSQKDVNNNPKFTEDQKKYLSSQGARRDFNINLALLPLDILSFRTMVYNPVSGAGEGLIEKALGKISKKGLRYAAQFGIEGLLEGSEEGFQQVGQDEGDHYAQVLSGSNDGSNMLQRIGGDMQTDTFWNNFAGGVLGSPIIGGFMKLTNKVMQGNRSALMNEVHKNYIENIGKMDNAIATKISELEKTGQTRSAEILRRQFAANKALSALHLDALTDKETAFDAHLSFLEGTLEELKNGKTDALGDLGFFNLGKDHTDKIKEEFEKYVDDAKTMKGIYDNLKFQYNKNLLPEVTADHFQLNRLLQAKTEVDAEFAKHQKGLAQYDLLSPTGQTIYNTEYELRALRQEESRLTNLYRSEEDESKKKNVEQVLSDTRDKITDTQNKFNTLQGEEYYSKEDKKKDTPILKSALRSRAYLQTTYDREHLDNEIAIKRKDVALWDDEKYLQKKNNSVIKNAKTKVQVEATEQDLKENSKDGKITPETQAEIDNKKNQLAAKQAAEVALQEQIAATNSAKTAGNSNLFGEDNELIDGIKQVVNLSNVPAAKQETEKTEKAGTVDDEDQNQKVHKEEYLFSPDEYDFDKSPEESKNQIIHGVRELVSKMGGTENFEDVVRHVIKMQGEAVADKIYKALAYGWEKNSFKATDFKAVYDKVFVNPIESILGGVANLRIQTHEQLETENDKVEQDLAKEGEPVSFDNNNQPVYTHTGFVTNESSPKLAFVSRLSDSTQTVKEDGTIEVSHDYTADELNTGDYVNSLPLLDPDKFLPGEELVASVPVNFMDIMVPVYNPDGSKGKAMTFGQYVASKNLSPEDQEYKDKLPIIIHRKGANSSEKGVAFVHDIGWYHPLRFNQDHPDDMKNAIAQTRGIREAVVSSTNKSQDLVITGKRQTTFSGLKTKDNISLREANPDTDLTVALGTDSLSTSRLTIGYPTVDNMLINNSPFRIGDVYDVRRYGTKNDKKTFVALNVIRPRLNKTAKSSVLQAINIYANRSNKNQAVRERHDEVVKQIKNITGLNILEAGDLEKYLQHFINTFNTSNADKNEDAEAQAKAKLAPGTPFITFIRGGNIVFGRAGEAAFQDKSGNTRYSFFINPRTEAPATISLAALAKDRMIGWYEHNVNLSNLSKNKPVATIDEGLNVNTEAKSYHDYLLDNLQTNVRSHNIGTKEKPNYVTNIQPVITYDLASNLKEKLPTTRTEIQAEQGQKEEEASDKESQPEQGNKENDLSVDEIIAKELADAKKLLGSDFGKGNNNAELFSPDELKDEQRDAVASSINRIAGLTPDQQFDIVDFMFNQITSLVNFETQAVTKDDVNKIVDKAFGDIIAPSKKELSEKIEHLEKLLKDKPELVTNSTIGNLVNDYKYRLAKIQAVENNLNVLREEAYNRVAKYTGITTDRVENEDIVPDEAEQDVDFWTDVLTESPDNKLTYSMRRFFGQVREYDKDGNPMTGFLGLPTFTGADTVIKTLMVTLADVPSDFDQMIAKLESRKSALPWMQEAINKLKGADNQKKQQFVTVMSNTSLRMKFTMISYNHKTQSWTTKVYDTNLNGVADSVKNSWRTGFYDTDLALADEDGSYHLNKEKAQSLISQFESWNGKNLSKIEGINDKLEPVRQNVKNNNPKVNFNVTSPEVVQEFNRVIPKLNDKAMVNMKGQSYQVVNIGNGKYQMSYLQDGQGTKEEVAAWLKEFGINLSEQTLNELFTKGMYHNYELIKPAELFRSGSNTNGLLGILYNSIKTLANKSSDHDFTEHGDSPLDNSVITSLANLEAKYNNVATPFGFRDNGKSLFALTMPKFITDRIRDLKSEDQQIVTQLLSISFSKGALWLRLLSDPKFKEKFSVSHIGLTALKQLGKKLYRDNSITKLSDMDHELTKLGMFWDTTQGEVSYASKNAEGKDVTLSEYPDTDIPLRMATMFSPTMSDKQIMTMITTAVLNLSNKHLNNGQGITDNVAKAIFEQTVKPELERMIKFYQNGGKTNISGYDKGAGLFLMMPELNKIEVSPGLKLIDAIKHESNHFTSSYIQGNKEVMDLFFHHIKEYVNKLASEKIASWEKSGVVVDGEVKHLDNKYSNKFSGEKKDVSRMIAMDFVVNSMIANANSFMTLIGDPALYFKSKNSDPVISAKDTFVNVGKRLANQVAPGTALANSEKEKYIQLFLDDRKSTSNTIDYIEKILGKEGAAEYRKIEGSDAQEYTTWKEHLDILAKMGKTGDNLTEITPEEIQEAREIFASDSRATLTDKQKALVSKVMQPIKPVYTGQIYDPQQDVMRTVYIKSSSFPLIPQLTAGLEIDKLRDAMEKLQDKHDMNIRASYQTANKVGSVNSPVKLWGEDGTINQDSIDGLDKLSPDNSNLENPILVLDRKNFRIQQEVPFKSGKNSEDKITLGTQLMKLLFGDEMMDFNGFEYNGKSYNGKDLQRIYNDHFLNLVNEKRSQLFDELGLDHNGVPVDQEKSVQRLQQILKDEAVKRGYPLQDIEGLSIVNGEFNLPLWSASNSNRYESMLNAIITNRLVRMKFPGNSYVVGSEEGFKVQRDFTGIDKSKIIWTSKFDGELKASYTKDGKLEKAQVLVASKFRNNDGELVDLLTKEGNEYKYVTKTDQGFKLKEDMFEKGLLDLLSFRIPSSGHQSASSIEIVGFLPHQSADLMIVPKDLTKQKGLDFDVDKENTYQLWHHMEADGKFSVLSEEHRDKILASKDKELQKILQSNKSADKLIASIFGDEVHYSKEDIESEKFLKKMNSKINEKLLQNEIVKIHHSIMSNPDPKVQAKVIKTLNTNFAEEQADFIENLTAGKDNSYWTPLSDEYQKSKMFLGASGKIGTGAYSLDVVFHSLAQQAALNGKPIRLIELVGDDQSRPKTWVFGNLESNHELGSKRTVDGSRTVSELIAERQNVSVDNEKLQVMGRVGLNDSTLDVDKVFNMVGLDKGSDGNSISFLFLSQPIIKEYVERMKNSSSNMAEFVSDKEGTIIKNLLDKYDPESQDTIDDEYWKKMSGLMTNENFINAIKSEKPDGKLQAAVLLRFLDMKQYGLAIRGIQSAINTDSKGLGKSFFDVIEKRNALNRIAYDSDLITGASGLIGEYESKELLNKDDIEGLTNEGYTDIGEFMVKPTTLSGGFSVHGVATAYNLWSKFFPYDSAVTQKAFTEIMGIISRDDMSDSKIVETKQDIFRGMKRYFSASKSNGIINSTDDINAERKRLFVDSDENTSLAKYMFNLVQLNDNPVVNEFIKTNKLINRFEYTLNKNGQPSLIKFNNASGEEFDEQYLYESLASLMEIRGKEGRIKLPQIGNKNYTLDTLAQDLIAYCYLGNSIQEAVQFTKYVPVSYLNQVGYSQKMRAASLWLKDNPNILGQKIGNGKNQEHLISEFAMQFIQHNPERVRYKISKDDLDKGVSTIKNPDGSFNLKNEDKPIFISVYDSGIPKGEKKFHLYWFDGEKYTKVPVLGAFGMDEYQPKNRIGTSLINGRTNAKLSINPQSSLNEDTNQPATGLFSVESGDPVKMLESIKDSKGVYSELASRILPFVDNELKVVTADIPQRGIYNPGSKTITISNKIASNPDKLADTIVHEVIHHLTLNQLNKYITVDEKTGEVTVDASAPSYVTNLTRIYNDTRSKLDQGKLKEIVDKVRQGEGLPTDERNKLYGYTSIHEFVTMTLTNSEFQSELNKVPYKRSGQSVLDKFKEVVKNLMQALGVKFDENYTAAHAISNIFGIIQTENERHDEQNPWGYMYDEDQNTDNFDDFVDGSGGPEAEFSPETFPNKPLSIKTNNCN